MCGVTSQVNGNATGNLRSIVICPANTVIYNAQTLTCESSLFFQHTDNFRLCQRKLLLRHQTPILQRHGALWVYFFPERRQVTLRCPNSNDQMSRTVSLLRTGLIHNLSKCYISSTKLRTLPELFRLLQAKLEIPNFYLPSNISAIANHETRQLEDIIPADTAGIDDITSRLTAQKQTFDVDSIFDMHRTSQLQEQ